LPSRRSRQPLRPAPRPATTRAPRAPRASSDRPEPPDARACRAARTVARLAFRGSAGDFDVHPDERRASFAGARGVSFLPIHPFIVALSIDR
jgi:hypothetical protein